MKFKMINGMMLFEEKWFLLLSIIFQFQELIFTSVLFANKNYENKIEKFNEKFAKIYGRNDSSKMICKLN